MQKIPSRSISSNSRIKLSRPLDESMSLYHVNQSLMISSSQTIEKSLEKLPKFKLPRLPVNSARGSNQDTPTAIETSEDSIQALKHSLHIEWNQKNVPKDLQEIFSQKVWTLPRHKAVAIVLREIEDLKGNRSLMISALRAVIAREESLASIHEMNNYLKEVPNWEKMKDVQLECAELLHAHRILTINAVESIVKWRELIAFSALVNNEHSSIHIPFIYSGTNYLAKLRNDLDFLKSSEFSKVFAFEDCDPLLVKPSKPIVKAKEKKIDSNYFIQHGKVVVSLPSSLKNKVEYAEDIIGREVKTENSLTPAQVEEISNVIYEELCEEEVEKDLDNYIENNKPEVASGVSEKITEEAIDKICREIAKECKFEANKETDLKAVPDVMEKMLNEEIERIINEIAKEEARNVDKEKKDNLVREQRLKEENANIARLIYNDLFGDVIEIMATEVLSELDKHKQETDKKYQLAKIAKENKDIAEKLRNELIEEYIKSISLEISESIKGESDLKRLTEQLYSDLVNQLIQESISEVHHEVVSQKRSKQDQANADLASKIYESLLDSLCLEVPDICSEAFEEAHQIFTDRSELLENMGYSFPIESTFADFSSLVFNKINVPESVLPQIVEEYYPKIPLPEQNVTAEQEKLEEEIEKLEILWYWGMIKNVIVGLLVFSVDFDRNDVRVINVFHLTCLNWSFYSGFIDAACKFIWDSDHCQEIRVNLYVQGPTEIPSDVKKIFNTLKFRWKTNIVDEEEECSVIVMGKMRPQIKLKESPVTKKRNLLPTKAK